MKMNMGQARQRARQNKLSYGGEWRVVKTGRVLWIQHHDVELPSDGAVVYNTATDDGTNSPITYERGE